MKNHNIKLALSIAASISALCYTQSALAQSALEQPEPSAEEEDGGEIIVTAQRRAQSAQDVPIALSVIDGDTLAERQITNIKKIETLTPSLEITPTFGTGQPIYRLRGVGFDDYTANNSPTVGVYVNDVAYTVPVMTQGVMFDVARVEVLRGPQGTLYGRNTTAGAINLVNNSATDILQAGASLEYGRFDALTAQGFISGPLGGGVRGRVAAITEQGGAWQKNRRTGEKLGDADRVAARLSIDWGDKAADYIRLNAHYYRDTSDGLGGYLLSPVTVGTTTIPADTDIRNTDWGSSAVFEDQTGVPEGSKPFRDNEGWGVNLYLAADLGFGQLTSVTAYERLNRREFNDFDATAFNITGTLFNSAPRNFTHEVRIASTGDSAVKWLVGGFYGSEKLSDDFRSDFLDSLGFTAATSYKQRVNTRAIFGQTDVELSDRLTVTGGLRYEDERRRLRNLATVIPEANVTFVTDQDRDERMREVSGKAIVNYELSDDARLYASVSRGVKSGGFTTYNTLNPAQADPFTNEVLWAYEAGLKSELAGGDVRLNASAFYYDYTNQQIQGFYIDPVFGAVGQIVNIPESEIYGGEIELNWMPTSNLNIQQSVGYKKGKFIEFLDIDPAASVANTPFAPVFIDRSGQSLFFPKLSYSGSIGYTAPLGGFDLKGLVDYSYRDKEDRTRLGSTIYNIDEYWLVNMRLTLKPSDTDSWSVYLYGRNVFDTGYDATRNFFLPQAQVGYPGQPATYGIGATFKM